MLAVVIMVAPIVVLSVLLAHVLDWLSRRDVARVACPVCRTPAGKWCPGDPKPGSWHYYERSHLAYRTRTGSR